VFVLQRLEQEHLEKILGRALQTWRGPDIIIDDPCEKEALKQLAVFSDGDGKCVLLIGLFHHINGLDNSKKWIEYIGNCIGFVA
jgi:replication-associated recombination protein RarA